MTKKNVNSVKKNVKMTCSICGRTTEHMYVESTGKYVCSVCGHAHGSTIHYVEKKKPSKPKAKNVALNPIKEMVEKAKNVVLPKEEI